MFSCRHERETFGGEQVIFIHTSCGNEIAAIKTQENTTVASKAMVENRTDQLPDRST